MNQSDIHLLDLPVEILLAIFKKLGTIDVFYSLWNIGNNRLDNFLRDETLTNYIDLTSVDDITI
ncbi:unnamed protein product, partial [Adineta steineri]